MFVLDFLNFSHNIFPPHISFCKVHIFRLELKLLINFILRNTHQLVIFIRMDRIILLQLLNGLLLVLDLLCLYYFLWLVTHLFVGADYCFRFLSILLYTFWVLLNLVKILWYIVLILLNLIWMLLESLHLIWRIWVVYIIRVIRTIWAIYIVWVIYIV